MKRYLCILDYATGMAEIQNVSIVEAENDISAKEQCVERQGLSKESVRYIKTFDLDTISIPFHYFN